MVSATSKSERLIVVSDTTPLSELAKIGRLDLLRDVYGRVVVPQEVFDEVTAGSHPATVAVPAAKWIEVRAVTDSQQVVALHTMTSLGLGECAAIILAEELNATRLLIDDLAARREALSRKLPVVGTVAIVLLAKKLGIISVVRPLFDDLIAQGARISQRLYSDVLNVAGE